MKGKTDMSIPVGIDVSKNKLDIYFNDTYFIVNNIIADIKKGSSKLPSGSHIVMEATGKYHRLAHETLSNMGHKVMLINPYRSRHFANAQNIFCKTDKVDAKVSCQYAKTMEFKESTPPSKEELLLQDLSKHLEDLKQIKIDIEARIREASGFIAKSLKNTRKTVVKEIESTEKAIKDAVDSNLEMKKKAELLTSIPGIGETTAFTLLCCLRELGKLNKNEIAALAGLAPMNHDSGTMQGRRRIRGGRHDVRSKLYMPIIGAATQHNSRLKAIYTRLCGIGKSPKVALTACMRKLIVWANAILATGQPWCENYI